MPPPRQPLTRPSTSSPPLPVGEGLGVRSGLGFTAAAPPPPRTRTWEKTNPTTGSYRLPADLAAAISTLAKQHHVTTSDIARLLLEYSLTALDAGALTIEPQFAQGKLTLFPEG